MPDVNMPHATPTLLADPRAQKTTNQHRVAWTSAAILLAAGLGGAGWWFTHQAPPKPKPQAPMKVPVVVVTPHTVPIYRSFPATAQAVRTVAIQARVTGYLAEQDAVDGAYVESGALLYRIDIKDYQVAFAQARATLNQATASLAYSRANNGRNQRLANDGWVSRDTADQSQSNFHQGEATQANNTAGVRAAALNLGRTEIRAPFAGRLSASQAFTGTLISVAGATLNTLVQLDPIYVSFNPAEANLDAITRAQNKAPIQTTVIADGSTTEHKGPLTFIDNQVSLTTGTILLRATISNQDHVLLPGQYVTARLHLGDLTDALTVPQSAVSETQIGQALMVIGASGKVEQRIVTLGDRDGTSVVVLTGLKRGDHVIVGQLQKIKAGQEVTAE